MSLQPVVIDDFKGLDFRVDRVGSQGALVAHDVLIHSPGRVRRRPFTRYLLSAPLANAPGPMHAASGQRLLVVEGTFLRAIDTSAGTIVASQGGLGAVQASYVNVSSPTFSHVVIVTGGTTYRYDTSADTFAAPAFTGVTPPNPLVAGLTPWDNRVAYACASRLYFSDPGDPYTVETNNYVDLSPGDGEAIVAIETWRDYVFVFKQSKFFVFYGTSTDSVGGPVFNYRPVVAAGSFYDQTVAHRTGVYFVSGGALYRTTGGEPEEISGPIGPAFNGGDGLANSPIQQDAALPVWQLTTLGADDRFVYAALSGILGAPLNAVAGTVVYDTLYGNWTTSSFTSAASTGSTNSGYFASTQQGTIFGPQLFIGLPNEKQIQIYSHTIDLSPLHDNGTGAGDDPRTVNAYYWTGWLDLVAPAAEKVIRDTVVTGQGRLKLAWARDYATATPSYSSVLQLGAANQTFSLTPYSWARYGLARARTGIASAGELLQLCMTNEGDSSAYFEAHRVSPLISSVRAPGMVTR